MNLITNQKNKINICLSKIRNILLNLETQEVSLQEQLQNALTEKENHKNFDKEKQTLTFQFNKDLKMIGILFTVFPFSKKNVINSETVFVIDWSTLQQFQSDEYYITVTNLDEIDSALKQIQNGEDLNQDNKNNVNLFFNLELEKLLNYPTIYFPNSYLRTWNEKRFVFDGFIDTNQIKSPNLLISSNFLSKEDVVEVYNNFKNVKHFYNKLNRLTEIILEKDKINYSNSFYPLWEKHNSTFEEVKRDLFDYEWLDDNVCENFTHSLFWSNPNSVFELYSKWNELLNLELTKGEHTLQSLNNRICYEMLEVLMYHKEILTRKLKSKETIEFAKFLKNVLFHLYKSSQYNCGSFCYSNLGDNMRVSDIVFNLLNNSQYSQLILQQIQMGEELPVTYSHRKYLHFIGRDKIFISTLRKLIIEKDLKISINFDEMNDFNQLFVFDKSRSSRALEELIKLKKDFPCNIQIVLSEVEKKKIQTFIKRKLTDNQKDEFQKVNNFLETFGLK